MITKQTFSSQITAADFLKFPTPERFLALGSKESEQILDALKVNFIGNFIGKSDLVPCNHCSHVKRLIF